MPFDPFCADDGERTMTFLMPTPGARAARPAPPRPRRDDRPDDAPAPAPTVGLNPLVAAAHPLLALVPQIRATASLADLDGLRHSLARGLREFEVRARARGIPPERALAARYILCTVLDEAAAGTPWGGSGQWGAAQTLLVAFHGDNLGGVKVIDLMAHLAEDPTANRDLLELIYAALALGFEGRFHGIPGGRVQLEALRARLADIVRETRGPYPPGLAQHWQGAAQPRRALLSWLPLWVSGAVAALLLLGAYLGLAFSLDAHSDPVFDRIQALRIEPPAPPPVAAPLPPARPRLTELLASDIAGGALVVREAADRSVVTMGGDSMFEPGSATLSIERGALLGRVARAIGKVGGEVLVTGHTDAQPMRSLRFPSNWELSQARADAVRGVLVGAGLPAQQVRAEGRGAGQPVTANDTVQNRARNRRIEIIVAAAGPAPTPAQSAPAATASAPATTTATASPALKVRP